MNSAIKKTIILVLTVILTISSVITASATSVINQPSPRTKVTPSGKNTDTVDVKKYPGYFGISSTYHMFTRYGSVWGDEVCALISVQASGYLRGIYELNNNRYMRLYVMEDDPSEGYVGTNDDYVVMYEYRFNGNRLTNIVDFDCIMDEGRVDSNGDLEGEFYIATIISRCAGDRYTPDIPAGGFKFHLRLN